MDKQSHARKRRQFKSLCKQLNRLIQGEHTTVSKRKIETILLKIKYLLRELSGIIARWEMKKTLGAAAVIFGLAAVPMQGQSFAEPIENPFGLSSSNTYINLPVLADLDGDGDMDLLIGEYDYSYGGYPASTLNYYENIGTPSEPEYGPVQTSPFGLDMQADNTIFPAIADLDGDGDLDVLATGYKYSPYTSTSLIIVYYENTGTATNPAFVSQGGNFPFGTSSLSDDYYVTPAFADLDGDGDMDLIAGISSYTETFKYLENIGTPSEPEFATPQSDAFGLSFPPLTYAYISLPAVIDIDADGDIDLICGISGYSYINGNEYYGGIYYFENTGSTTNPQFEVSERNPFDITIPASVNYGILVPSLADMDNDGDIDMLCSVFYGNFLYYENTETTIGTTQTQADFPVNISPNPTNDYLNINTDESLSEIQIYDLTGRQIATFDGQQMQISIQDLSSGTYILRMINQEGQYLSKRIEKL